MDPDLNRPTIADRKRYPLEPLARAIGVTLGQPGRNWDNQTSAGLVAITERLDASGLFGHFEHRRTERWHQHGVPARYSDTAAIACGQHPTTIWPGWDLDVADGDPDDWYADDPPLDELDATEAVAA